LIPLVTVLVLWNQIKALYAVVGSNQVLVSAGFEKVLPLATYIRTYVASLVDYYFWRFLFPTQLSVDPLISPVEHWYSSEFLFSVAVLAGLVWMTLRLYKQEPLLGLGIAAALVSPLLAYADIPLADVVQEHRANI